MEIIICPKCESKIIKKIGKIQISYKCISCGRRFSENTKKLRLLKDNDFLIVNENVSDDERKKIYNFLFSDIKSKNRFLNCSDIDNSLKRWLDINYIKFDNIEKITVENVYFYLSNMKEIDRTCKNDNCTNKTNFIGIRNRYIYKEFCSDMCLYEWRSKKQIEDNSVHKMTKEKKKEWKQKLSIKMKDLIKNGDFTPCVTNSWCHSKIDTMIKCKIVKHRSSWESFFHIVNPSFLYEKLRIEYLYEGNKHNYIVDFVDNENKILYEVKPDSEKTKLKNRIKRDYAEKWCNDNGYIYKIISNTWYKDNFKKYKYLIIGQPEEENLLKKLRQFDEN